jgi:uncharacterized protein (DUF1697 family)
MTVYICLLRGINVGGNKRMKMADLRALLDSLGIPDAQTILQSGNVVFRSDEPDPATLAATIEAGIQQKFGFDSRIILRTTEDFSLVMTDHPFSGDQLADEAKMLVMFLEQAPSSDAINALMDAHSGPESIHISGREAFIFYPNGMGRSKLTNTLIEKHLRVAGTGRNWKTVNKLRDLAAEFESS